MHRGGEAPTPPPRPTICRIGSADRQPFNRCSILSSGATLAELHLLNCRLLGNDPRTSKCERSFHIGLTFLGAVVFSCVDGVGGGQRPLRILRRHGFQGRNPTGGGSLVMNLQGAAPVERLPLRTSLQTRRCLDCERLIGFCSFLSSRGSFPGVLGLPPPPISNQTHTPQLGRGRS